MPPATRRSSFATRRCSSQAASQEIAWPELRRQVGALRGRARRRWASARRPRRRVHAQRAADGGRVPRLREPRRDLVGVLARHGAARRARPLPPDRAEGADRVRRLSLRRRRARPHGAAARGRRRAAERPRRRPLARPRCRAPTRRSLASAARRVHDFAALVAGDAHGRAAAAAVRSSALDRLLERHDRPAEGDRPRPRRRHARGAQVRHAAQRLRRRASSAATATTGTARPAGSCGTRRCRRCSAAPRSASTTAARPGRGAASPGDQREVDWTTLWRFVAATGATFFGAGAAFYASCEKAGIEPRTAGDLSRLRALGSTGSPLAIESYRWLREHVPHGRRQADLAHLGLGRHRLRRRLHRRPAHLAGDRRRDAVPLSRRRGRGVVGARRRRPRPRARRRGRRARLHQADAVDAALLLGRRAAGAGRPAPARQLLRHVPRHLAPRRLAAHHAARRRDHLRPQRRDHQPPRHPHGHGRAVPRGRGACRRCSTASSSTSSTSAARATCRSSSSCARASRSTTR